MLCWSSFSGSNAARPLHLLHWEIEFDTDTKGLVNIFSKVCLFSCSV
jgi:hypothetical protein